MLNHTSYAKMPDQNLIESIQHVHVLIRKQPDILKWQPELESPFMELWSRWWTRVYRYCCFTKHLSHDDAEEVATLVFKKMWQGLSSFEFRSDSEWEGWIYTIANNATSEYRRSEAKRYLTISLDSQETHQDGSTTELSEIIADTYYAQLVEGMQDKQLVIKIAEQHGASWKEMALLRYLFLGDPLPNSLIEGKTEVQIRNWQYKTTERLLQKLSAWAVRKMDT